MTRINVGIPPAELIDKHLIAEHREIKRIPNLVSKGKFNMDGQPSDFKLGTGHVKFFYDKLAYLHRRYVKLYKECKARGFNVQYYGEAWDNVPMDLYNDWEPTLLDIAIVKERIREKLNKYETSV